MKTILKIILSLFALTLASNVKASSEKLTIGLDWFINPDHCLLYTSPSPRDVEESRMPSSA